MTSNTFKTREEWLDAAIERLRPRFEGTGATPRDKLAAIVSWPYKSRKAIGQCFHGAGWTDCGTTYVTVSPILGDDPARVLDILLHELVHACGIGGHGKDFKKVALKVGLTGKMKATEATPELRADLEVMAEELGPYPHQTMREVQDGAKEKKESKGTRIRLECANDEGYAVDMNRRKFEDGELIAPICPHCGDPLQAVN